ncbi:M99 family carboxypeptidase catalytic domain-containing protein [Haloarchaeobius sp. TZWWS8]|uniref:M99 family carboxypeptidase catalytic domain-containing protein n=1 Tax=Haloarchaeobius sp. TZWWS8 TaxID=3446121 RepID=UPI003EB8C89C
MNRRRFLRRSVAGVATAAVGTGLLTSRDRTASAAGQDSGQDDGSNDRSRETLLPGTKYETEVVTIETGEPGPTAVVVGGLHGDERSGFHAAEAVATWSFRSGTVIVLPRANVPAIEANTRENDSGDLNRQFPPGSEPETRLARAIWKLVADADPDVVLDLHRSLGIYGVHRENVGQAVFPTATGDAVANAEKTTAYLNEEHVPWSMPLHDFSAGGGMGGTAPLLAHKVGADLDTPAYIVETTIFLTTLPTRVDWTTAAAEHLLAQHGVERRTGGGGR